MKHIMTQIAEGIEVKSQTGIQRAWRALRKDLHARF